MNELFQNTYIENGYLIQNYEDFKYAHKYKNTVWSPEDAEEPYVQFPKSMFQDVQGFDSITMPSYILYNDVYYQFYLPDNCSELFSDCSAEYIDLHYIIDTSNVTNMRAMFCTCKRLQGLDLSNFDTSKVMNIESMFLGCKSLTDLDLSRFDTSNVTNMNSMFGLCHNITCLDPSNFNTSNVTNMEHMFYRCKSLTSLDLSNFDTSGVTDMSNMFEECPAGDMYKDDERFIMAFNEE